MRGKRGGFFRDRQGRMAIVQWPNVPLLAWAALWLAARAVDQPRWVGLLDFFSTAFLFTWAWMEITQGVSPFRRALGALVMVAIVAARVIAVRGAG